MALDLSHLSPPRGSRQRHKRVGRGNASGRGTYSGRGLKGQRSRSGGRSGLKVRGMKARMQKIPKLRGFRSPYGKAAVVNVGELQKHFQDGQKVTPRALQQVGLTEAASAGTKILASGTLSKKLTIQDCAVSAAAKVKIEQAGGKVV
ncbi:50S ribosomal protein L15 [Candidatus Falkowbacteria bacterium]|nr:50S ribosomal protein L15 [Candidatus Falkowbacteria bacterium]